MTGSLITSLMLDEAYVVHVLGFEQSTLNEGRYNVGVQQEIFEAHLLAENWFKSSMEFLKDKGAKGIDKLKDKAYEVPNAIKEYGEGLKGIVAAIAAMVRDPAELQAYTKGIYASIRRWPRNVLRGLASIAKWMEERNMPTFAKGILAIKDGIKSMFEAATKGKGWVKAMSMLVFGLAVKYIEEEFGLMDKLKGVRDMLDDPKKAVTAAVSSIGEFANDKVDELKDFFSGKVVDVSADLMKRVGKFIADKIGFIKMLKEKFIDVGKAAIGSALEQFAGPIAWIKKLAELFKASEFVVKGLSAMLTKQAIDGIEASENLELSGRIRLASVLA